MDVSAFSTWLGNTVDLPALVLLLLLYMGYRVTRATQANPENGFDFADMLRDDRGKPSSSRMAVFVCLALTSWALMYIVIHNKGAVDTWLFLGYAGIWSGAKVVDSALAAYTKTNGPPTTMYRSPSSMPVLTDEVQAPEPPAETTATDATPRGNPQGAPTARGGKQR